MSNKLSSLKRIVVLPLFLGIIFAYFFFSGINLPYVGPNAANFNNYSLIAKNYNLFGFLNTKFGEIISVTRDLPSNPEYYLHHPPLLSIIEALFFKTLGYSFWVGRLVVVLFSLGSLFLIFAIGKNILNKRFAWICAFVYVSTPGSVVFGKMIGQEPLVLFFSLMTAFFAIKYLKNKSKKSVILIIISVILGTLSDWPMTYFSFLISVYLFIRKEIKLGLIILFASLGTALLFLIYVYFMMSGFSDIGHAIAIRTLGSLINQPFWAIKWILIIILRFVVYFNPILTLFAFYYLLKNLSIKRVKKENILVPIVLIFFGFGLIHILLYPEGSFGHPYWIYYLIPFIVFSSSFVLFNLFEHRRYVFFSIFLSLFIFTFSIQHWKQEQIRSNIWRDELAQKADTYLYFYEPILINSSSAIDPELLMYRFSHEVKAINSVSEIIEKKYRHFLYSCTSNCSPSDKLLFYLLSNYKNSYIHNDGGEAFIFDLRLKPVVNVETKRILLNNKSQADSFLRKAYKFFKSFLNTPQI